MAVRPPARKGTLKTATLISLKCWLRGRKLKVGRLTIPAVCTDGDHPGRAAIGVTRITSASEREGRGRGWRGWPPKIASAREFERALARIIIFLNSPVLLLCSLSMMDCCCLVSRSSSCVVASAGDQGPLLPIFCLIDLASCVTRIKIAQRRANIWRGGAMVWRGGAMASNVFGPPQSR